MSRSFCAGCRLMRSSQEADVHFLTVGWTTHRCFPALFPCSAFLSTHPLLFQVHRSWRHFSSCAAYIWENFLWFILISSIYMQFMFFFALKILLLFKTSSLGFLFSLLWNYVLCHFFPTTLSLFTTHVICG